MKPELFKLKIESLRREIDGLGKGYHFLGNETNEEFLDLKESAIIDLDEIEKLIEGNEALKLALALPE